MLNDASNMLVKGLPSLSYAVTAVTVAKERPRETMQPAGTGIDSGLLPPLASSTASAALRSIPTYRACTSWGSAGTCKSSEQKEGGRLRKERQQDILVAPLHCCDMMQGLARQDCPWMHACTHSYRVFSPHSTAASLLALL